MDIITDVFGNNIRLTEERLNHILLHPEMQNMTHLIEQTLVAPLLVKKSNSDKAVYLYYEYCLNTDVGDKWLCVAVKHLENDAFVVTAYLTDKPKTGEIIWQK